MASPSERIVAGDGAGRTTARLFDVTFSLVVAERRPWVVTPGELDGTQQDWGGATDGLRDDPRNAAQPCGMDTIRLRVTWPAAPVP